ncbi:MAG TPA: heavy-metal-associated domain-containing protein [Beutenbergiaceae bacterium]|nr:heavy-metal-associated domain-containing protein [Beutenbergiaceae bacterium]
MSTHQFHVTGMSCGGCEASVREAVAQVPGVTKVEVSAHRGRLVVTAHDLVDDHAVISAVHAAGYQAAPA